jgi:hypothetical protein
MIGWLVVLIIIAIFIIARLAGVKPWLILAQRMSNPNRKEKIRYFIGKTAEDMLADERAVTAVYAQAQRFDSEAAYLFTVVNFFWTVIALTLSVEFGQLGLPITLVSAVVCFMGMWAMGRTDERIDLYCAVIDLYEDKLGLPKRP